jgi:hypothetical protein
MGVEPSLQIRAGEEAGGAKGARLTTLLRVGSAELNTMDALSAAWTMSLFIPCKETCLNAVPIAFTAIVPSCLPYAYMYIWGITYDYTYAWVCTYLHTNADAW